MAIKVLVFESDPAFAEALREGLRRYGCEVSVVDDANAGLQAASQDKPDLILLAIELPRMNGFSVCNKLKRDPALKDVPLIIMSSDSTEETFEQHRRLRTRAEEYVHKPVSFDDLLVRIEVYASLGTPGGAVAAPIPSDAEPMSEEAIVLDDDIEIEDAEVVEDAEETATETSSRDSIVDADVEDFADQAFDALMGEPEIAPASIAPAPEAAQEPAEAISAMDEATDEIIMDDVEIAPEEAPAESMQLDDLDSTVDIEADDELEVGEVQPAVAAEPPTPPAELPPPPPAPAAGPPPRLASMRPSSLPPRAAERGDVGKYREELEKSRNRVKEIEEELRRTKDRADELEDASKRGSAKDMEVQRMQRELDEVKAKLASSGKSAGSAREFLDLREQLNKKDKEILDFKDQLSHKDKELIGLRDGAIGIEREKADLSDKIGEFDRQVAELLRSNEALKGDKEQAVKRAEDFKRKAEKTKVDLDARVTELSDIGISHQTALAELDEREATLVADHQQALQEAVRQHEQALVAAEAAALAKLETARQEAREAAEAEHERAVLALKEEAQRQTAGAVSAREAELKKELDSKLAALHRANEDALGKLRAEHEQSLADAAAEADKRLAEREAELVADSEQAQAKEAADHSAALLTLIEQKQASETTRDAHLAAVEAQLAERTSERDTARGSLEESLGRVRELEASLADRTNERDSSALTLQQRDAQVAQLEAELAERTSQRDQQKQNVEERDSKIVQFEAALAAAAADAAETKSRLDAAGMKLARASTKWNEDRVSLERAKDALAAALGQIEEAEGRPFE